MTDELNPGIRRVVALLNEHGFITVDSGDGETHDHACDRDHAYVTIRVFALGSLVDEADRLAGLLQSLGVPLVPLGHEGGVAIQASYDPTDTIAVIDVQDLHDGMLPP